MRPHPSDPRPSERAVLSVYVPRRDGPRRVEQAIRLLLGPPLQDRSNDHERRRLRPRLDRPPGPGPDD
jgi:hypothetical protein